MMDEGKPMKIGKKREKAKLLEETWPAVFNFDKPKPLKIGIFEDMCAHIPKEEIKTFKNAIKAYCGIATYLWALTKHTHRYDLEGNPFIEITDDERAFAQKQIEINQAACKLKAQRKKENIKIMKEQQAAVAKRKAEKEKAELAKAEKEKQAKLKEDAVKKPLTLKAKTASTATVVIKKKRSFTIPS